MSPIATSKGSINVNMNAPRPVLAPDRSKHELEINGVPRKRTSPKPESRWEDFISIPIRFVGAGEEGEEFLNFFESFPLSIKSWKKFKEDAQGNQYTDMEAKALMVKENNRRDNAIKDFMKACGIALESGLEYITREGNDGELIHEFTEWARKRFHAILWRVEAQGDYPATNRISQLVVE